jgi:hypothetical protein
MFQAANLFNNLGDNLRRRGLRLRISKMEKEDEEEEEEDEDEDLVD